MTAPKEEEATMSEKPEPWDHEALEGIRVWASKFNGVDKQAISDMRFLATIAARDVALKEAHKDIDDLANERHADAATITARDEEIADLRATLYKLVQVASARDDWKQSTWKFIEECNALATKGGG